MRDVLFRRRALDASLRQIVDLFDLDSSAHQRNCKPSLRNRIRRVRPLIGTPEWEERTRGANLPEHVVNPFAPFAPELIGNDPVRDAALARWGGTLPHIGGNAVGEVAALLMRMEFADEFVLLLRRDEVNKGSVFPADSDPVGFFRDVILPNRRRAHEHASFA